MSQNVVEIIIKAIDNTKSGLSTPVTNLQSLSTGLSKLNTFFGIGAAAATYFFETLVQNSIESAANLQVMSEKTGVAVETLSTLGYAAKQSDTDLAGLAMGMKKMSTYAVNAAQGNIVAMQSFKELGITVTDGNGKMKSQEELLLELADSFSKMKDGAEKSALAVRVFGKSGTDMIPFLDQGRAGIEALQGQAVSMGLQISGNTAEQSLVFVNALKKIEAGVSGLGDRIIDWMIPSLATLTTEFASLFEKGQGLANIFDFLSAVLNTLYHVVLIVWDAFEYLLKTIATLTAGLLSFIVASTQGWDAMKGAARGFADQLKQDTTTFDNLGTTGVKALNDINKASKGLIDPKVLPTAQALAAEVSKLKKAFEIANPGMSSYFNEMDALSKKTKGSLADLTMGGVAALGKAMETDLSTALTNLATGAESFSKALTTLFDGLLKATVGYVAQLVSAAVTQKLLGAVGSAVMGSSTAASATAANVTGTAWAAPAALVSLASFGANAPAAQAGILSTAAIAKGLQGSFLSGTDLIGSTGNYQLHQGEAVINPGLNSKFSQIAKGMGSGSSQSGVVHVHFNMNNREMASQIINLKRLNLI